MTISLSSGARLMARERVIVKRLESIEDFGAMSILCTDKTGTMTIGEVELQGTLGADGQPSATVRRLALLNAKFQAGFANPIDEAIVSAVTDADVSGAKRLGELPYDFTRKCLSVLVDDGGTVEIVTKGALDQVLAAVHQRRRGRRRGAARRSPGAGDPVAATSSSAPRLPRAGRRLETDARREPA